MGSLSSSLLPSLGCMGSCRRSGKLQGNPALWASSGWGSSPEPSCELLLGLRVGWVFFWISASKQAQDPGERSHLYKTVETIFVSCSALLISAGWFYDGSWTLHSSEAMILALCFALCFVVWITEVLVKKKKRTTTNIFLGLTLDWLNVICWYILSNPQRSLMIKQERTKAAWLKLYNFSVYILMSMG